MSAALAGKAFRGQAKGVHLLLPMLANVSGLRVQGSHHGSKISLSPTLFWLVSIALAVPTVFLLGITL